MSAPFIHPTATIGFNSSIGPFCYIGPNVHIGADCQIQPGAKIGLPGFGYHENGSPKEHRYGVVIKDNVHIGANTCIDAGSWRATWIGAGTRIDNLCHIAHNVQIGERCYIVALAELSGSVIVEDGAWVAPSASVKDRLRVGKGATVGLGAAVIRDVPADTVVAGVPAKPLEPCPPALNPDRTSATSAFAAS